MGIWNATLGWVTVEGRIDSVVERPSINAEIMPPQNREVPILNPNSGWIPPFIRLLATPAKDAVCTAMVHGICLADFDFLQCPRSQRPKMTLPPNVVTI